MRKICYNTSGYAETESYIFFPKDKENMSLILNLIIDYNAKNNSRPQNILIKNQYDILITKIKDFTNSQSSTLDLLLTEKNQLRFVLDDIIENFDSKCKEYNAAANLLKSFDYDTSNTIKQRSQESYFSIG